jgi:succinyl-CoA synthetase beta subunit
MKKINPFIIIKKKPRVRAMAGKVKITSSGLSRPFKIPRSSAKISTT